MSVMSYLGSAVREPRPRVPGEPSRGASGCGGSKPAWDASACGGGKPMRGATGSDGGKPVQGKSGGTAAAWPRESSSWPVAVRGPSLVGGGMQTPSPSAGAWPCPC